MGAELPGWPNFTGYGVQGVRRVMFKAFQIIKDHVQSLGLACILCFKALTLFKAFLKLQYKHANVASIVAVIVSHSRYLAGRTVTQPSTAAIDTKTKCRIAKLRRRQPKPVRDCQHNPSSDTETPDNEPTTPLPISESFQTSRQKCGKRRMFGKMARIRARAAR